MYRIIFSFIIFHIFSLILLLTICYYYTSLLFSSVSQVLSYLLSCFAIIHIFSLQHILFSDLHARLHLTVVCMIIAPVTSDNMNNFKDGGRVCSMLNKKKTSTNTLQQIGQLVGRSQQPDAMTPKITRS